MNEGQIVKRRTLRSDPMFELALHKIRQSGYKCYTEAIYEAVFRTANQILKSDDFPTMKVMDQRWNRELDQLEKALVGKEA